MVSRQVIRPAQADDIRPHEHDTYDISGVFGFLRALRAIIDGDLEIRGFVQTAEEGNRIVINPAGLGADEASIQLFSGEGFTGESVLRTVDLGSDIWGLVISGPDDGGGQAEFVLRTDSLLGVNVGGAVSGFFAPQGFWFADGTEALPSITFSGTGKQDDGLWSPVAGSIAVSSGGSEVARFTADAGHNLQGLAWTTWTPTLTNLNIGSTGTQVARYVRVGNTVHFYWSVVLGGTGISVGSVPTISLPVTASSSYIANRFDIGDAEFIEAGVQVLLGRTRLNTTSVVTPLTMSASGTFVTPGTLSATSPFTWGTGDIITLTGTYEAA